MILTHFSKDPFHFEPGRQYEQLDNDNFGQSIIGKPNGLWLSDESSYGWKEWCRSAGYGDTSLATNFVCDLTDWCLLLTSNEILAFTEKYSTPEFRVFRCIDWVRVKKEFSGILITPYDWKLRLDPRTHWYYGWDCASACVWDLMTVKFA